MQLNVQQQEQVGLVVEVMEEDLLLAQQLEQEQLILEAAVAVVIVEMTLMQVVQE